MEFERILSFLLQHVSLLRQKGYCFSFPAGLLAHILLTPQAGVQLIEAFLDIFKSSIGRFEAFLDGFKASIDPIEASICILQMIVDRIESFLKFRFMGVRG